MTKREISCGQAVTAAQAAERGTAEGTKALLRDAAGLWQECFGDSDAYTAFYFTQPVKRNKISLYYDGGTLAAMLHQNPYRLSAKGRVLTAEYVVGAATREKYRRQGLMRALMEEALRDMYVKGREFCFLRPAKECYYTPFGFRTAEQLSLPYVPEARFASWRKKEENGGNRLSAWEELKKEERAGLVRCGNRLLSERVHLFTELSEAYLEERAKEMRSENGALFALAGGEGQKGLLMTMREGNEVYLANCILPEEAAASLIGIASRQEAMGLMFRIVRLDRFLEGLRSEKTETFALAVYDRLLPENNGVYRVRTAPDGAEVKKETVSEAADVSGNAVPIEACIPLFFGKTAGACGYRTLHIYDII